MLPGVPAPRMPGEFARRLNAHAGQGVHAYEDDRKVLKAFEGLRVADVSDGMDFVGLHDIGLVNPSILPLWKDTTNYTHRIIGIAVTVRYVPTQQPPAGKRNEADFDKWVGDFYNQRTPEPFVPLLREGSVVVIEEAPETDVGSIGSNNIMNWKLHGAVGVITSSTSRDTDEIITQKVPLYFQHPAAAYARVAMRSSPSTGPSCSAARW